MDSVQQYPADVRHEHAWFEVEIYIPETGNYCVYQQCKVCFSIRAGSASIKEKI